MELFRRQVVVLVTLFTAKEPVSGVILSQKSGLSLNTLKKEIDELNCSCADQGFEILSKTGSGYEISINDRSKYFPFRRQIISRYHRNLFFRDSQTDRAHYIIRRMLSHDHMFVEDIADECFCSVSTINRDMKDVKKRLEVRKIKLVNHTNRGMKLEGREWNIRIAFLEEYHVYKDFETTYHIQEDSFEKQFLDGSPARENIDNAVMRVLEKHRYPISYNVIKDLCNLFALTVTRQRHQRSLARDEELFSVSDDSPECLIVSEILAHIGKAQQVSLNDCERHSLAAFLKASRIVSPERIEEEEGKEEALAEADGFLEHMKEAVSMPGVDTGGLRMDLACSFLMLRRKCRLNIHTTHSDIAGFARDGLMCLDFCALLYFWLKEKTDIACTGWDVLSVYYIFSYFSKEREKAYRKRILVVSRYGIYAARGMAFQFERLSSTPAGVEYIPCEYLDLKHMDMDTVDCIATDIEEMQKEYPGKTFALVHYYRRGWQASEFVRRTVLPREVFREKVFRPADLVYTDQVRSMADIEQMIREDVLGKEEDASAYLAELERKNTVFPPGRQNQIMVLNTLTDLLGRDFFRIVVMKKPVRINNALMSLIVMFNVKDNSLEKLAYINGRIAALLHTDGITFTMNPREDYEKLVSIMYEG